MDFTNNLATGWNLKKGAPGTLHPKRIALWAISVFIALLATFPVAQTTSAQEPPRFESLVVTVLPEYDQPRVLVIVKGELPAATPLPLTARIRVPDDATVTNTCSVKEPNDEEICTEFTSQPEGENQIVMYELSTPTLYIEYYYGSFSGAGPRSADISFWPPFGAQKVELAIPVPSDATDFNASPAPTRTMDDQGSKHYLYNFDNVSADAPINVTLAYSRPTDEPWAPPPQSQQGSAPTTPDPNDDGGIPRDAVLFLALAAALTVAFIGYNTVGRRIRLDMGLVQTTGPPGPRERPTVVHCGGCGAPSRRVAGYCSSCGRELRPRPAPGNQP